MEQWLEEDPRRQRVYVELREIWMARGSDVNLDRAWSQFLERAESDSEGPPATESHCSCSSRPLRAFRRSKVFIPRAAVIAFLVLGGGILARNVSREPSPTQNGRETIQSYVTDIGELSRILLSDGTQVVLGVRSKLQVTADFGVDAREVHLQGEAFFQAAPDLTRPFLVHTAEASTRAVGTGFSVRSRGSGTEIIVREGTVLVTPSGTGAEAVELPERSLGHVSSKGRSVEVAPVDLSERLAWMEGRLIFKNAPLRDVLRELELWYAVAFRVEGPDLPGRRLNAFLEHPPLDELLTAIAMAVGASFSMEGNVVSFSPRS